MQGFSVVPWWTWLVLGLVLGLILLVVARMLYASWQGREEEEKKRQKREESRQRKIERELRKTEERNHKKSVQDTERELSEDESEGYDGYHLYFTFCDIRLHTYNSNVNGGIDPIVFFK